MTVPRILLTLCLGTFCSIAYGQPDQSPSSPPSGGQSDCEGGGFMCMAPWIALILSKRGSHFISRTNLSESDYNAICSTAPTALTCVGDFMSRCAPAEKRADVQRLATGITKVLSLCNEPNSHSKFIKLASCCEKITTHTDTCMQSAETGVPEVQKLFTPFRDDEFVQTAKNPPSHEQLCCTLKKFKECIAPSVQSSCTADEKTVADTFGERALRAFDCTDAIYRTCRTA